MGVVVAGLGLRTTVCLNQGCTATDEFIVAALAENESISPKEVQGDMNQYQQAPPPYSVTVNWHDILTKADPNNLSKNLQLIGWFKGYTGARSDLGVDWSYIDNLVQNP